MKNRLCIAIVPFCFIALLMFAQCSEKKPEYSQTTAKANSILKTDFNGFESQVAWGEHLVLIGGCNDCHTPKKMSDHGPVLDSSLWLSGHPLQNPPIDIDRSEIERKGLSVTSDLTEWVGPWGVSFAANLTPDPTGIGSWDEAQFIYALREGKFKGTPGARTLLPPMPWEMIRHMTDGELKAMFSYLKTLKPINNLVPAAIPPISASN